MLLFNEEPFVSIDISDILKIELLDSFKIQLKKCNGCCAIEPTNLVFFIYGNLGKGVEMTSPLKKQIGVYF